MGTPFIFIDKGNQERMRGILFGQSYWAYGLFSIFDSLLDCLCMHAVEDLLNNIAKSYPNPTIISKNKPKFKSLKH